MITSPTITGTCEECKEFDAENDDPRCVSCQFQHLMLTCHPELNHPDMKKWITYKNLTPHFEDMEDRNTAEQS